MICNLIQCIHNAQCTYMYMYTLVKYDIDYVSKLLWFHDCINLNLNFTTLHPYNYH